MWLVFALVAIFASLLLGTAYTLSLNPQGPALMLQSVLILVLLLTEAKLPVLICWGAVFALWLHSLRKTSCR